MTEQKSMKNIIKEATSLVILWTKSNAHISAPLWTGVLIIMTTKSFIPSSSSGVLWFLYENGIIVGIALIGYASYLWINQQDERKKAKENDKPET